MEEEDSFYYDMCNIARILPTLSPSTIYTELNTLKDNSERVQIIIRKYFEEYEPKNYNCMTEDIKKIKRVLPTYPIVRISNDLLSVESKENRVQIVLKNYFDSQNKLLLKRCLDNENETDTSLGKKFKLDNDSIDFHSDTADLTDNVSNKEQSSNETQNYSPLLEDFQYELIPQKSETKDVEVASSSYVQKEFTEKPEDNSVSLDTNDQISCDSKEIQNECENTEPSSKVDECGLTLLSILSNLFPQHSLDVFNAICEDFGLNLHGVPNEITTDLVVNVLLNYTSNANKFEQDKTEVCKDQSTVTGGSAHLSDICSTVAVLCGDNKDVADCDKTSQKSSAQDCNLDLEDMYVCNYLKETVKDILSNIETNDKNNDVQTSLISEEPVQTEDISSNLNFESSSTSENIPLIKNLSPLLPSIDSTASTSTNSVIYNRFDKPFNITSTSTNISDLSPFGSPYSKNNSPFINNLLNLRNELNSTNHILNSNIDPGLFPIVGSNNNFQPVLEMSTKQPVLPSRTNSIIKPATFHPTSSLKNSSVPQSDTVRIDLENVARSSKILKPASFHPKSKTTETSTNSTGISKTVNTKTSTSSVINSSKNLSKTNTNLNAASLNSTKSAPTLKNSNKLASSTLSGDKNGNFKKPKVCLVVSQNLEKNKNLNATCSKTSKSLTTSKTSAQLLVPNTTFGVKKGNTNKVQEWLTQNPNLNASCLKTPKDVASSLVVCQNLEKNKNLNATCSKTSKSLTTSKTTAQLVSNSTSGVKKGNTNKVQELLGQNANLNATCLKTPKDVASSLVVCQNLEKNKNFNATCSKTSKSLTTSKTTAQLVSNSTSGVKKGNTNKVQELLGQNANLNATCSKTLKNVAASNVSVKLVSNKNNPPDIKKLPAENLAVNIKTLEQSTKLNATCSKPTLNVAALKTSAKLVSNNLSNVKNKNMKLLQLPVNFDLEPSLKLNAVLPKTAQLNIASGNKTHVPKHANFVQGVNTNLQNMNYSRPSTSGINKISKLPTTSSQDINKNTIRVRTDLYDTFFNGPVLQSKSIDKMKQEENDDIIFVSAKKLLIASTNKNKPPVKNNENVAQEENQEIKSCKDQQSTSKACDNHPFYFKLLEIFPDICPNYLKNICSEIKENQTMDDIISILLIGNYSKRTKPVTQETHLDFEEQHKLLLDLFPDADPTYLQHHCERLIDQADNFKQFVASLLENQNYPTKTEYLKKVKLSAQEKQYTTEFNVKNFLEVIPNPEEYFNDPKRQAISGNNMDDINYAITFLKNTYCTTAIKDITSVFKKTTYSILKSAVILEKLQNMKTKRKPYPITSCKNIPLLQEIAYVKHRKQIEEYIKNQESEKKIAKENAKLSGLMKTCQCCYDDEVMPDDTATCETGLHIFCKSCIRKSCEVVIGDGKLEFSCLETCDSFFTLQILQSVLSPKVFSKMAQRKQLEEVKSAGIEDLESCPFCDFATIPAPEDKIFRCLNDDCMKESCRLCKEPTHIPLRCDEVEKDKDVKMRTYIENKMTEALLRQCYKCGLKFIKESGCNKMTCSCGAMMCYVCNQPVKDYKHFNGQGGDQLQLCPLYSDTHKLHVDAVKLSAESAKKELGIVKEDELKIDPSADLEQHYRRLAQQNPAIPNIPNIMPPNVLPR